MSTRKVITVNEACIKSSQRENSANCMTATAIKEAYPGAKKVSVDMQTIRFTDASGDRRTYLTPSKAQLAIVAYDAGDDIQPFEFFLANPVHIQPHSKRTAHNAISRSSYHKAGRITVKATADGKVTKVGGRPIPVLGAPAGTTRRRYGIRGLRINQDLEAFRAEALRA